MTLLIVLAAIGYLISLCFSPLMRFLISEFGEGLFKLVCFIVVFYLMFIGN